MKVNGGKPLGNAIINKKTRDNTVEHPGITNVGGKQ